MSKAFANGRVHVSVLGDKLELHNIDGYIRSSNDDMVEPSTRFPTSICDSFSIVATLVSILTCDYGDQTTARPCFEHPNP